MKKKNGKRTKRWQLPERAEVEECRESDKLEKTKRFIAQLTQHRHMTSLFLEPYMGSPRNRAIYC